MSDQSQPKGCYVKWICISYGIVIHKQEIQKALSGKNLTPVYKNAKLNPWVATEQLSAACLTIIYNDQSKKHWKRGKVNVQSADKCGCVTETE